jgi:hypothetical protein
MVGWTLTMEDSVERMQKGEGLAELADGMSVSVTVEVVEAVMMDGSVIVVVVETVRIDAEGLVGIERHRGG